MKLWLASYHDDNSGSGIVQIWATSKRGAKAALQAQKEAVGEDGNFQLFSLEPVVVPTTRSKLADFLNEHASVG